MAKKSPAPPAAYVHGAASGVSALILIVLTAVVILRPFGTPAAPEPHRADIAVEHGGALDIRSEVGVGTTVAVRVPAAFSYDERYETAHSRG